jgi:DNA-binding transcriptional regulator YdaS (Cro superfamily)
MPNEATPLHPLAVWMQRHTVSQRELGVMLGVSQPVIAMWLSGETIPMDRCVQIEEITAHEVLCEDLRPDRPWYVLRGYREGRATPARSLAIYRQATIQRASL